MSINKRGRKGKSESKLLTLTNPSISSSSDENHILKLNIKKPVEEDDNNDLEGFTQNNNFISQPHEYLNNENNISFETRKVVDLLKDFEEKNKNNEWPVNTHIACYWCCHKFNSTPFGMPLKYTNGIYKVCGCFCSLECTAAYNFESKESRDEIFERYNLINQLSREIGHKFKVKPAPHRFALQLFGGHLSIDEFRMFCYSSKIINLNFPPMNTLTQQLEEINECDLNLDFKYIPFDNEKIKQYNDKEKLKLKRNKPIYEEGNTLDKLIDHT